MIIGTIWYARKFGSPLITIMKWIQNIGSVLCEQPLGLHNRPVMLNRKEN
ncbi:integral membrane sensor signal transduction histidine kinase [Jeotgalibacillus soli]|uniref:Integral membrane sensor signal transduction histidine kinase n=1 Tax=Jeotgalibacillus soli TaxID=889306 RepID=A0A0C2V848_9BACL|nr:integral membrane sensor signal transduction histidine kinase [Jeotgalibacillus soli]